MAPEAHCMNSQADDEGDVWAILVGLLKDPGTTHIFVAGVLGALTAACYAFATKLRYDSERQLDRQQAA